MMGMCLRALMSHWRRNGAQVLALVAGLAMATALWCGVQAINAEARASYDAAAGVLGEGQFDQLVPRDGDRIALADYVALRRAGWQVSPMVDHREGSVRIIGIDPLTAPPGLGGVLALSGPGQGVTARARAGVFVHPRTRDSLQVQLPVTADPAVPPGIAIGDIQAVQRLAGDDHLSRLIVLPTQPLRQGELQKVAPTLLLLKARQTADIAQLTDSFHLNLTAFGLLSFVVGLFIVHSTIGLAFEQRRSMVRTLRSLGVPLATVLGAMAAEMAAFALVGGGLGVALGYLIAAALLPDVAATLDGLYGAQVSGALQIRPQWWASGLALAVGGTAVAMAGHMIQTARMPLLASARPRAWVMASARQAQVRVGLGLALMAAAGLLAARGQGLMAGFALLGCMLVGGALLFPILAGWGVAWASARSKSAMAAWFWADTRQQLPGLSLALMALLLAVSANVGVATMVSSFRVTFVDFLDQRLAADLYVQVDTAQQSAALDQYLQTRGAEVLPLARTEASLAGQRVEVWGIRVGQTYRDNWVFLDATDRAWDTVQAGQGVILNEQLARRQNLWVGSTLRLTGLPTLPVLAVVGDYGNPNGQVIVGEGLFHSAFPNTPALQFGARTATPSALAADLIRDLGIDENAMVDQAALKGLSLDIFERTFLVTGALNVLTLGVAGFAMLMSLLTLADLRLPQLAPVWAMGQTRRCLGGLELGRALVLAVAVFLCALPLGLGLAWVLLSVVNVAAFGWKLPMFLFWDEYARLALYTVLAAALAALWPVRRLMSLPPATLVKVFSNER